MPRYQCLAFGRRGEERDVEGFGAVTAALRSVVAITVTPFDGDDHIDEKAYASVVQRMVAGGVRAVTPNGNTSEFYALTPDELDRAVAITVDAVGDDATVVAGVGYDV